MKKRNIYQNQSQELLSLFESAGSSAKVMCVPMDYAKKDHWVMFCNGHRRRGAFLCKLHYIFFCALHPNLLSVAVILRSSPTLRLI